MTRHSVSVLSSARGRWVGGALAGAIVAAASLSAAQASVGGYQEDPNIYSPDFWSQTNVPSAVCAYGDCRRQQSAINEPAYQASPGPSAPANNGENGAQL